MVRAVHHHHGASGCIGPCDCPNPCDDEPSWGRKDRPPPSSYEGGTFHPGPGCEGYREHIEAGCWPCFGSLARARDAGERWALAVRLPGTSAYDVPARTFLPGRGEGADEPRMLRLRPQHVWPLAALVAVAAHVLTGLLPWPAQVPVLTALVLLLVVVGGRIELDRTPRARLVRR